MQRIYVKKYEEFINFDPLKFNSFSELKEKDLYEIAEWGLALDYSSGVWDEATNEKEAKKMIVDSFKRLLIDNYPEGFKGIPNKLKIYRMIKLDNIKDFNNKNVGYSWFANPDRISNPYFKQQLEHLNGKNVYLITAEINQNQINIPNTLFQRDMIYLENEIVLKNDENIKIIGLDKIS